MKTKPAKKGEHDETIPVGGKDYLCRFREDAHHAYHVTCAALPSVFAYGLDLPSARRAVRDEIEALISDRERRYEADSLSAL